MENGALTQLRDQLLSGPASKPVMPADSQYVENLRRRVRNARSAARSNPSG
jgi:hypothetical protein